MSRLHYAVLLTIVLFVGVATLLVTTRPVPPIPTPSPETTPVPLHTYLVDVAGWYEITPNETAIATPFDFSLSDLKVLPSQVGRWSGAPYDYGSAVDEWFENPDVALSNLYHDNTGHQAWFSIFGSRGRKSYFLFEHTPITSYPAAGWTLVGNGVAPISISSRHIYVQKATLTKGKERRVVFYWYMWSDLTRDPAQGVLTVRLHVPVVSTDQDASEAGADFIRTIFLQVIDWHRF